MESTRSSPSELESRISIRNRATSAHCYDRTSVVWIVSLSALRAPARLLAVLASYVSTATPPRAQIQRWCKMSPAAWMKLTINSLRGRILLGKGCLIWAIQYKEISGCGFDLSVRD